MKIYDILNARVVQRFHTLPTIRPQTIADHSWGVASIAYYLCQGRSPKETMVTVFAALMHDVAESRVGDTPAHVKRKYPELKSALDAAENVELDDMAGSDAVPEPGPHTAIVKMADCLDLLHYCIIEQELGNQGMAECFDRGSSYLKEVLFQHPNPWAQEMLDTFRDRFYKESP